ncbi:MULTISPECIES: protein TolQ [unclassified Methylophilus]|jgi:biopolymer transport protein TolQ|uniref:protein TolQ n=1 Tax=unclassified Methylophilus TaxID=2630143 RepID=UPI0006FD1216|nr:MULTISPECIES: protein TolQ [unclassified Methylophilus]KQT33241.1 protein TolQ [Methylophilus sp. Leaf414]KQT42546.1 protein TolQ [Methylophilus sp. Leaf416]KQT56729.1 protein TolQ [Methylophilus sp. Leaf459]
MNVTNDMSIFTLVSGASLPVQVVMLILLLTSLASWWYIFIKVFSLKAAAENVDQFEAQFWSGGDLNELYERIGSGRKVPQGMASIFQAGLKEFIRHKQQKDAQKDAEISDVMEATRRAMRAAYNRELDYLDSHLPFLASVGSVSPYIGLFGTVWGIMNSFRGLSNVAQATLSQVAPGIAEALVATAIGLFAAIPAVIAYNRFAANVDRLLVRYESFMEEFTNILQRRA